MAIFKAFFHESKGILFKPFFYKLKFSMHQPSGQMLSLSQFVHLCVCVSVCVSGCLFTFEVPLKRLFVPNSRSRMSKIFRGSEFLGKSYGKKWSQT